MNKRRKDFFVGYLPMPEGLKPFYKWLTVLLLVVGLGFSYWVSSSQQAVGKGQWLLAEEKTYQGYLSHDPYPVLHVVGDEPESIILMSQGKHSSANLTSELDGNEVTVTGFPIERGGWKLLELRDLSDVKVINSKPSYSAISEPLGEVTLSGEIIDSKCFMGVMKPGEGKVHRACAAMCIAGGIPPLLVVNQSDGNRYGYILIGPQGQAAADLVIEDVAVPVSVFGQLERRGDLTYLRIAENGINRI
ncbi:MAG: hypothetical protein ACI9OI_001509 [Chitinophagales bacterium]|jgi:hypothetical protein